MKRLRLLLIGAGLVLAFSAVSVQAQGIWDGCEGNARICGDTTGAADIVKDLINLLLWAIGVLAVIMIIHSGLKYVTSRGDAAGVKSAKDTLLYAVIGLVVAILAFAIVNFVIGQFGSEPSEASEAGNQTGGAAREAVPSNSNQNTPSSPSQNSGGGIINQ